MNNDQLLYPKAIGVNPTHSSLLHDEEPQSDEFTDNGVMLTQSPEEELLSTSAPRLTDIIADGNPEYNLPSCLIGTYDDDTFFGPVIRQPDHYAQFHRHNNLLFLSNSD